MTKKSFPARLHVILARDASTAIVIRRGPSKSVATFLWDRRTDTFSIGQWMHGRIYERRCDLSPDGKYFIYFAMNGRWESETKGAWTAISRAPYLKAIVLLGKGDCWNGGGLFTSKTRYWLNNGFGHSVLHDSREVQRNVKFLPSASYGGECPGVYYLRLQRDGWIYKERQKTGKWKDVDIFEKPIKDGWILQRSAHAEIGAPPGKGCYWDEHHLVHETHGTIECRDWEWADVDRSRLLWATGGILFSGHLRAGNLMNVRQLQDFNDMRFEALEAPY